MKSTFTDLFTFKPILICLIMVGLYVVSAPTLQAQSTKVNDDFTTVPAGPYVCLLYTSDAADERSSVVLGGRRIIKKQKNKKKKKNKYTTT